MVRRTRAAVVTLAALAAASCSSGRVATPALPEPTAKRAATTRPVASPRPTLKPPRARLRPVPASLVSYGDCHRLVGEIRKEALAEVGPYGLAVGAGTSGLAMPVAPAAGGAAGTTGTTGGAATGSLAMGGAPGHSTTNNQEAGVDEPDLVKTDGQLMVVAHPYTAVLEVFDVSGPRPLRRARLALHLDGSVRLLLVGHTVVALGDSFAQNRQQTSVVVVDLDDPRHPRVVRTFRVDGNLLDARLLHGRVLLVTQSWPDLPFTYPTDGSTAEIARSLHANRRLISRTTADVFLPAVTVTPGGARYRSTCEHTLHPGVASGLGTTSVITLDPASDRPAQNLTVVGSSSVVYASTSALYLATTSWRSQQAVSEGGASNVSTDVHGFDVAAPDHVRYLGSGSVPGTLTDQYSLSEHKGFLRVATTTGEPGGPVPTSSQPGSRPRPTVPSDNRVTVLRPVDGALVTVGQVRGVGRGERIYGVRFLGDIGYVVTFRQIDPLYVIDLSDPHRPQTRGELKVTGNSSALYPLGNDQLLGVGQAATDQGHPTGTQVSVFDVHERAHPTLLAKVELQDSWSTAQDDHHSLLWWSPTRLLVLPLNTYADGFEGSVAYRVGPNGSLHELGRVRPPTTGPQACCGAGVLRTLVVGEVLYSVTGTGLVTNKIGRLDQQAWLPFS